MAIGAVVAGCAAPPAIAPARRDAPELLPLSDLLARADAPGRAGSGTDVGPDDALRARAAALRARAAALDAPAVSAAERARLEAALADAPMLAAPDAAR